MKKLLMLVVLILIAAGAFGQSDTTPELGTGQWLYGLWTSFQRVVNFNSTITSDVEAASTYTGFVSGATAVMRWAGWLDIPSSTTYGQAFVIVGKYLDAHPEEWNMKAQGMIYKAMYAVWPGPKKPGE